VIPSDGEGAGRFRGNGGEGFGSDQAESESGRPRAADGDLSTTLLALPGSSSPLARQSLSCLVEILSSYARMLGLLEAVEASSPATLVVGSVVFLLAVRRSPSPFSPLAAHRPGLTEPAPLPIYLAAGRPPALLGALEPFA
jgi:hypothetical protein